MKTLLKPFTRECHDNFVAACNRDGKLRIERYDGNLYALYEYETLQDGKIIDLRDTEEYQAQQTQLAKENRREEILVELEELDQKRIRAICEPDEVREDNTTWLQYYNSQIAALREELNSL